jgi:hypothetical protein
MLLSEVEVLLEASVQRMPSPMRMHFPRGAVRTTALCIYPRVVSGDELVRPRRTGADGATVSSIRPNPFGSYADIVACGVSPPYLLSAILADMLDGVHGIHAAGYTHGDIKLANLGLLPEALELAVALDTRTFGSLVSTSSSSSDGLITMGRTHGSALVNARLIYFFDFGLAQRLIDPQLNPLAHGTASFYLDGYFSRWAELMDMTNTSPAEIATFADIQALLMTIASFNAGIPHPTGFHNKGPGGGYPNLFNLGNSFIAAVEALPVGGMLAFTKHLRVHEERHCVSDEYHRTLCLPLRSASNIDTAATPQIWVPEIWQVLDQLSFTMIKLDGEGPLSTTVRNPMLTLAQARDQLRSIAATYLSDDQPSETRQSAAKRPRHRLQ